MSRVKELTTTIQNQIDSKAISRTVFFYINSIDYTSYLQPNFSISFNKSFGAATATFILDNNTGLFNEDGSNEINVGDTVELIEQFTGDSTQFKRFYGFIKSKGAEKSSSNKSITLLCLDIISTLNDLDIDLVCEGNSVKVTDEVLTPVYLDSPNENLAQLFNFANDSIATNPLPTIKFKNLNHEDDIDVVNDGFEIYYDTGQLKLGSPLNVRYNYEVQSTYYYYVRGLDVEDVIEDILTEEDAYGKYLFGESSAQAVIDNHLTETINNVTGSSTDNLYPNTSSTTITIETTLDSDINSGDTSITLTDATGFPDSGEGSVNGDIFTWSGKTGNILTGIPSSGSYSLNDHNSGDYTEYETSYDSGRVWYLSFNRIITSLGTSDFDLPLGVTVNYFDTRYGRIILSEAISTSTVVTCSTNYSFNTLQATGVQINKIVFRTREVSNRLEAINKIREYCAPNYCIMTKGDDKIWSDYLTQNSTADYDLELNTALAYQEDEDLYTRVVMWGKNKAPTNVMFGDEVDYTSDEESSYTGTATLTELSYFGEERSGTLSDWADESLDEAELLHASDTQVLIEYVRDKYINKEYASQDSTGYYVFGSSLTNMGKIILGDITPTVYINDVPVDNDIHQMSGVPITVKQTIKTISEGGGKSKSVSVSTYYYYTIIFPHTSIVPDEPIYLYNNQGILQYTLSPNDPNMNYADGIWTIPGIERNDIAEVLSTATYKVLYSLEKLKIDYNDVIFRIDKSILPEPESVIVRATFEYWAIAIAIKDINLVVDGRRDTQLQVEFFGEPPAGFHLGTIDLGTSYNIQAIDMVSGFFKPDEFRKFDINFKLSLQYSTNGTDFYDISDTTNNISFSGGEAVSFEEEELGSGFEARYLKFNLEETERIDYGKGRYIVAITEISVYTNIIIKSEATLIPTTTLTSDVSTSDTVINVVSTSGFTEPESGNTATAYIGETTSFTYQYITSTSFQGCDIESGGSGSSSDRVSQTIETDTTLYDDDALLPKLGDRVYHSNKVSDRNLFVQSELDDIAKAYLREFYKNHSKLTADLLYAPYLNIGNTIHVVDSDNNVDDNYFIEQLNIKNYTYSLVLAKYPS